MLNREAVERRFQDLVNQIVVAERKTMCDQLCKLAASLKPGADQGHRAFGISDEDAETAFQAIIAFCHVMLEDIATRPLPKVQLYDPFPQKES